MYKLSFIVLG